MAFEDPQYDFHIYHTHIYIIYMCGICGMKRRSTYINTRTIFFLLLLFFLVSDFSSYETVPF